MHLVKKKKRNNLDLNPLSQAVSIYLIIYFILLFYTLVIYTIGYSYKIWKKKMKSRCLCYFNLHSCLVSIYISIFFIIYWSLVRPTVCNSVSVCLSYVVCHSVCPAVCGPPSPNTTNSFSLPYATTNLLWLCHHIHIHFFLFPQHAPSLRTI